jgi:hypothetical protein
MYQWNARVYNTLALASRLAAAVKDHGNVVRIAYDLHSANKSLSDFMNIVNEAMEGKRKADPNAEPVTPQMLRSSADNLEQLYRTLDYVVSASRRARLTNYSLTAGSLRGIERHLEAFANLADWFDLAAQPEAVDKIFEKAKQERDHGALTDLANVE